MKFIRRHDLTLHTRIEMVRLAWLHQGIYGKMTQIAQEYHISRTFLYQLIWAANLQLETLFSDQKPHVEDPHQKVVYLHTADKYHSLIRPTAKRPKISR